MNSAEYVILDAARMDGLIYKAKELNEHHRCLYEGDSEKFLSTVAPWMFQLDREDPFAEWLLAAGEEKNWDLVIIKAENGEALYKHLRKFLIINTKEEKELYFRYYEPVVLQAFLPTCNNEQLIEFFGPVESFVMANEEGSMLEFKFQEGQLQKRDLGCDLQSYLLVDRAREEPEPEEASNSPVRSTSEKWDFGF